METAPSMRAHLDPQASPLPDGSRWRETVSWCRRRDSNPHAF